MGTKTINRRSFIAKSSAGLVIAGAGMGITNSSNPNIPVIKDYRKFGRTGFMVSDIGCGPAVIQQENLLKAVLESGVNILDTAEFYGNGNNEAMVGRAIRDFDRKSLFLNTKLMISATDTQESIVERTRKCLERLQTDYVDGLMLWNPNELTEIKNEAFHKAVEQLKSEGRVRFCGISHHGQEYEGATRGNMEETIITAIEDGRFDVVLFVYNYAQQKMGENILKMCVQKNIGSMLMKTDPLSKGYLNIIEKYNQMVEANQTVDAINQKRYELALSKQKQGEEFLKSDPQYANMSKREAAIRFLLNNQAVGSILITFQSYDDIPNYVSLSGSRLTDENVSLIQNLRESFGHLYCRHACGQCEGTCPHCVPVNTIMRYNYYFMAQGREKYAMQQYDKLQGNKTEKCIDCNGYCEQACPYGVSIKALLGIARQNLVNV